MTGTPVRVDHSTTRRVTVETEIVEENLGVEQLNEEDSLQSFYNVSDELLEQLAEESTRVILISATVYRCDRTQSCGRYRNDSK